MSLRTPVRSSDLRSFLGAAGLVAVAATGLGQEPPRFPAAGESVRIDAVVVDDSGRPVTGLTAADFTVEENGEPRDISSFEAIVVRSNVSAPAEPRAAAVSTPQALEPEDGRALLIFFDDIHVSPPNAQWLRRELGAFLEQEVQPGDAVTIVAPHGNFWWTARTPQEHSQLPAVVDRLKGQYNPNPYKDEPSDWQVMQELEFGPGIQEGGAIGSNPFSLLREGQYGAALVRIKRTLNALERALDSLDGFRGRKSLVMYSEGFILSPRLEHYQRIVDRCRRANVALFVADPRGLRTGMPRAEDSTGLTGGAPGASSGRLRLTGGLIEAESAGSTHIALATGGRGFFSNKATEAVERALEESAAYYLIGFRPGEGPPGERRLRVKVRREGLDVRARNRYYRGDPLPPGYDDAAVVVALRALSDHTDVPFRVSTAFGPATGENAVLVRLRLELDPSPSRRELKLVVEARPLEKAEIVHDAADLTVPPSEVPLPVQRELRLAPGVWQARVVVRDAETGAMGSVLHTIEVPAAAAGRPAV